MASLGRSCPRALGLEGKIDHHDGVLLHDADQQDDADQRDDAELGVHEQQREQRADAGRRQRGKNRDRMNEALVEHSEHDVDGEQRGDDEEWLAGERFLKACAVPGSCRAPSRGMPMSRSAS